MEFKKFTKLVNTYDKKTLGEIRTLGFDNCDWVVTEKLDGANFSFWFNGDKFKVASRNRFVDGGFFNCQQVIDLYKDAVQATYYSLVSKGEIVGGDTLTIVGELVGEGINGRVKYKTPEGFTRGFYAFDLEVNGEPKGYLYTVSEVQGIPCAPLFKVCSFEEAISYNNTFKSVLTPDDVDVNHSEGVALSPSKPLYFNSGSRVYLKSKSELFKEKEVKQRKEEPLLSEFDNERYNDILGYINNNRVLSVLSKFGELGAKDFGKVLGLILEDVEEEYRDDNDCCAYTGVENKALVVSKLKKECSLELRKEFANKLTNNLE